MAAASAHTAVANTRSPGTCSGRTAAALATMPVPMTEANQFGPMSRNTSPGVLDITMWTGLEARAAAAVVFAVAGSDAQRSWVYERLRRYAGTHVVVGGCASYHAAVDHHLGALAASLGDAVAAEAHFG